MPELDLEDVRLKEPDELSDDEAKFLKENAGELTDDEKGIFKEQLKEDEKEDEEDDEKKGFSFASKDEFDTAVADATAKAIKAAKDAEEAEKAGKESEKEEKTEDFFEEGYKAKNWNEAAKAMYPKFKERVIADLQGMSKAQKDKLDEINKEFDKEIEELAGKDKAIPTKGTKEREAFEADLADIGVKYKGVTTMTEAYEIYKAVGGKKAGDESGEGKEEEKEEGKTPVEGEVSQKQRDLASKVSKGGAEKKGDKENSYARIASRKMSDLVAEEIEKLEA